MSILTMVAVESSREISLDRAGSEIRGAEQGGTLGSPAAPAEGGSPAKRLQPREGQQHEEREYRVFVRCEC